MPAFTNAGISGVFPDIDKMTDSRKASEMIIVYYTEPEFVRENKPGGVLIMQPHMVKPGELRREISECSNNDGVPLMVAIDQEGGKINRLKKIKGFQNLPSASEMANMDDQAVTKTAFRATRYLRGLGINTNFAPCLDPSRDYKGRKTFMARLGRSFGNDGDLILKKAGAFIEGVEKGGGAAVVKHFPGYDVAGNSDKTPEFSDAGILQIRNTASLFENISSKCDALMMNNIIYSSIDSLPAVLSPNITGMARDMCGDSMVIITDDLWAASIRHYVADKSAGNHKNITDSDFEKIVELAVRAGNDMLLVTYSDKIDIMVEKITTMMKEDPEIRAKVDRSVGRIFNFKKRFLYGKD